MNLLKENHEFLRSFLKNEKPIKLPFIPEMKMILLQMLKQNQDKRPTIDLFIEGLQGIKQKFEENKIEWKNYNN